MKAVDYILVGDFFVSCANCGNGMLGKEQGSLKVEETTIRRLCKCGFDITFDVTKGTDLTSIQETIDTAVVEFRNR